MIKVTGKGNISAEIIADSVSAATGKRITTFVLEYQRFVHSEFMTHRLFSRNAASSRAIPVAKMIELVSEYPAMPVHWGKSQAGMQAKEECNNMITDFDEALYPIEYTAQEFWKEASLKATLYAEKFAEAGYHKQIVNRLLEPFQIMRTIVTATEYDNFFYLRNHEDAQPEIHELARVAWEAYNESEPEPLEPGEWHTPFVDHYRGHPDDGLTYALSKYDEEIDGPVIEKILTLEEALKVSASCCAQVSFRKADTSLEKALDIYQRLVDSKPVHASPFEHQATPIKKSYWDTCHEFGGNLPKIPNTWEKGISHCDRKGSLWSGNFKSWIQYRQLIPNNVCNNYEE